MKLSKKPRKLAEAELFEYALKCLGARSYSTGDMSAKLRLRAARPGDIEPMIERLKDIGYLDDERFAASYALARVENEGFGKMRVLTDLRARRIPAELAEVAAAHALEGRTDAEQIAEFIQRRMRSILTEGALEDKRKLAAAWRKLRRAGFASGLVITTLKSLVRNPELVEEPTEDDEEDGAEL